MRATSVMAVLTVALAGCGGSTMTQGTEATTTSTTVATTSTTLATTTSVASTTTEPAQVGLSADACDQVDTASLQEALGVASVRSGSPFSTSGDGAVATCRFAITISGNLASAFTVSMLAPSETGAFEDALSRLDVGEPTQLTGLGTRAFLYHDASRGPLVLVEYENGAAAWGSADSANVYVSGQADAVLAGIMDVVVGPILRAIP